MTDKIVFNEYGNPKVPEILENARQAYVKAWEPYLDQVSILEVRALFMYIDVTSDLCGYILKRQVEQRRAKKGL